jgi:CRISPR-associated endoribonuclease Cas6
MRFQLTLGLTGIKNELPLNYQYELSAWIYKTIHFGNPVFSEWLHSNGYCNGNKTFKFFTFSGIHANPYRISGDRMLIQARDATLQVSFHLANAAIPFIEGLFKQQQFSIGDYISKVEFRVTAVEKLPDIAFAPVMRWRTLSPIIISKLDPSISANAQYISPSETNYPDLFFRNLLSKHTVINNTEISKEFKTDECKFKLLNTPRSRLVTIKAGTANETKVRGFTFDFEATAPVELLKIGYEAGFGEKNSMGFGCCSLI